jgi:hypothetical protein
MHRIALTLVLPLVLAVALLVPGTALADFSLSGSGHGTEKAAGSDAFTMSGNWNSDQLFGPAGTYYGSVTLGDHVACALWWPYGEVSPCPIQYTNCVSITGGMLWFGGYTNVLFHTGAFSIGLNVDGSDPLHHDPDVPNVGSSICRPLPGARYINIEGLENHYAWSGSFSTGLGNPVGALGALHGTSTWSANLLGGYWVDDFDFGIHSVGY